MAAEFTTPVCEVTGIPLPILPAQPRFDGAVLAPKSYDIHHVWHPKRDVIAMGAGGLALRRSRVQRTDWHLHHDGYHDVFDGPKLPTEEDELFRLTVLSAAGVVPRQAIDLCRRGDYKIVELDDDNHEKILNRIGIERRKPISRFFAEYAQKQDITEVIGDSEINEFLDQRTNGARRRELASIMLSGALELSVDNLGLTNYHVELKKQGLITAEKPKTFRWVAKHIVRLGHLDYFKDEMEARLATQF